MKTKNKFIQTDGNGALFPSKEKKSEKSPDYTGTFLLAGITMRISAWNKKAKSGEPYLSLSVKEKEGE